MIEVRFDFECRKKRGGAKMAYPNLADVINRLEVARLSYSLLLEQANDARCAVEVLPGALEKVSSIRQEVKQLLNDFAYLPNTPEKIEAQCRAAMLLCELSAAMLLGELNTEHDDVL